MCPHCANAGKIFPHSRVIFWRAMPRLPPFDKGFRFRPATFLQYSWPGNVRELEHTLERAVLMCRGSEIQRADLGLDARSPKSGSRRAQPRIRRSDLIRKALQRSQGNVSQAAETLGLSRGASIVEWRNMAL